MFDRRLLANFNWWYFSVIVAIAILGVVLINSANHARPEAFFRHLYIKQIYWVLAGLGAMGVALLLDYRILNRYAYLIYFLTVGLLIYVLYFGTMVSGARRWVFIGSYSIQISEFAKYALIIALAKYFDATKPQSQYEVKDLLLPAVLTVVLGFLIIMQPDLGTAMIIFFIFFIFLISVEINPKTLFRLVGSCVILAPMAWFFLKDYQKTRLRTLFNPEMDPLGAGYHTIQSKIAVGSGGFWGKGLFAGTQSRLNFLPEKHTDFIFSVLAEEMGFVGVSVLLILYLILILKGLNIAFRTVDRFGVFLVLGIIGSMSFYIIFNIGMTIGLFPVTGLPLPLLSYGGSSLITHFFALGLLLNIDMRRTLPP